MTDKVQKIREEVEKLKSQLIRGACSSQIAMETRCKEEAYNEVLSVLDTMQKEPVNRTPADVESAMQEVEEKARVFTEAHQGEDADTILAQMRGEEPVSKDTKESVLYNDMKPWEVPECIIEAINKKRVCPTFKGEALHKFKNEFNTLKQTLHLLYNLDTSVNYRLALHWASWGAQNLQGCFGISEEEKSKMDTEEPLSDDLEKASTKYAQDKYMPVQTSQAFKAGAKWQKEQIEKALLLEVLPCFMHGEEADEVAAKLDEVLNQKK